MTAGQKKVKHGPLGYILHTLWHSVGQDSSVGSDSLRAGQFRDQILVGARFSTPIQPGPEGHPTPSTMGVKSFLGVKWPGSGVDHPPPI